ncbi:MAG: phosphoribosylglycinamide formyltransferase [Candidatus Zixiibacteriota bacterium]
MTSKKARLAVFISGSGSNLQAIIDATRSGILSAEVVLVVSSRASAYGIERAEEAGIATAVCRLAQSTNKKKAVRQLLDTLEAHQVQFIALAGFLQLLPQEIVTAYRNRIANIHPGPLPRFGGPGMFGRRVHEAVLASGLKESGPTVHLVDEIYDHGALLEHLSVAVHSDDTPDTLAERVLKQEHKLYPRVLQKLIKGEYDLDAG